ncbi:tyrosine-type recombinase/integrase [Ferruginibacter albus]|uniref:tyrosine-type recombinase/integrase n=1 Tax=Ferruginibacter albus TaxID=2875540 RepID=UPI001CC4642C|nr:tyrosine-type recombinase/integrase [Ferruginibacter albus]UAY53230.1 tyrosine-type recombinase/integrase [Ferruginibacter albus]
MNNLQSASKDFLNYCQFEKGLNAKTIKAYKIDLNQLISFCTSKNYTIGLNCITKMELRSFLESISSLKPKTIKRKIATIKSLFNFLEFDDKILSNPFRKMKIRIKEPRTLPKVMNIVEIKSILKTVYTKLEYIKNRNSYSYLEAIRNIVLVEMLFATGARVSEIADLKTNNINLSNGSVLIKGKGNKERMVQVCNKETLHILKLYAQLKKQNLLKGNDYFLVNRLGNKISDQSIRNVIKNISKESGLLKNVTPHIFRHSFATLLLEKDVDIKYIQLLLGHSSIMTTQIYTHVNQQKQRQLLKTKHPRKDILMKNFLVMNE